MYTDRFLTSRLEALAASFPVVVVAGARQVGKTKVSRTDTRGITAFREAYPHLDVAPGLVVALCERVERLNGQDVSLPWDLGSPA